MTPPLSGAVIFVDDVAKVTAFYQAVAAMSLLAADARHSVLESPGFQLTVHALPPGQPPQAAYPPREDSYLKLCLPVADLAQAREEAARLGGWLGGPEKEWQARGFRACDGHDPEGNVIQLRQPAP